MKRVAWSSTRHSATKSISRKASDLLSIPIKEPHVDEVATTEAFPVPSSEVAEERRAVVGTNLAALLEFDNIVPDLPIGLEELGIDGLESAATTGGVGLGNPIDQILVVGGCLKFRRHGGESRKDEVGSYLPVDSAFWNNFGVRLSLRWMHSG